MFNLKNANHEVIFTSEWYEQKAAAMNGIESVRRRSPNSVNYEIRKNTSNQFYFVLKASNGQIIGKSEPYLSEAAAKKGIESVKKSGNSKEVDVLT